MNNLTHVKPRIQVVWPIMSQEVLYGDVSPENTGNLWILPALVSLRISSESQSFL